MALAIKQFHVVDENGSILPSAQITVHKYPGLTLAVLYSDRNGTVPISQPFNADVNGYVAFFAAAGAYRITATSGSVTRVWVYVGVGLLQEVDSIDLSAVDAITLQGHPASDFQVNGSARTITGDDTAGSSDLGKLLDITAKANLTFADPTTLPNTYRAFVKNSSSRRATLKAAASTIDGVAGATGIDIFPQQSCLVMGNGAKLVSIGRQGRFTPSGLDLFCHPTLGAAANDGFATGSGNALAMPNQAIEFILTKLDAGAVPNIYLANGDYTSADTVIELTSDTVGRGNQINIIGNAADPTTVKLQRSTAGPIVTTKDKGIVTLTGAQIQPLTNSCQGADVGQMSVLDLIKVLFTAHPGGTMMRALGTGATLNILGVSGDPADAIIDVTGDAVAVFQADFGGNISVANSTVRGSASLTLTYFCLASNRGGIQFANAAFSGWSGVSAANLSQFEGTIDRGGLTLPGSATTFGSTTPYVPGQQVGQQI